MNKIYHIAAALGLLAALPAAAQSTLPAETPASSVRSLVIVKADGSTRHINLTPSTSNFAIFGQGGTLRTGNADATYQLEMPLTDVARIYFSPDQAATDPTGEEKLDIAFPDLSSVELYEGETHQYSFSTPANDALAASLRPVWLVSNDDTSKPVAEINSKGVLTALAPGSATVLLTFDRDLWREAGVVTVKALVRGDANLDGATTVNDITTTVDYMLEKKPSPFSIKAADVNADAEIDILDIVAICNLILGINPDDIASRAAEPMPVAARYAIDADGNIWLECDEYISGIDLRIAADSFEPAADLGRLNVNFAPLADGTTRVAAFTIGGAGLTPGRHLIGHTNPGTRLASAPVLSDSYGRRIAAIEASTLGIDAAMADADAYALDRIYPNPFESRLNVPVTIAADGSHRVVLTVTSAAGATVARAEQTLDYGHHTITLELPSLSAGLYLVNLAVDGRNVAVAKAIKR